MVALAPVVGVILAGGRSSRMPGQFKGDAKTGDITLLERVLERFKPQVDSVLLNLNRSEITSHLPGVAVVADSIGGFPGPLAGLVAAFEYFDNKRIEYDAIAVVPCDGPFVPRNLVAVLATRLQDSQADVACIRYRGEIQPTFSLWRKGAKQVVVDRLKVHGEGGFKGLFNELATLFVDWPEALTDPFFNINTPSELALAGKLLEQQG